MLPIRTLRASHVIVSLAMFLGCDSDGPTVKNCRITEMYFDFPVPYISGQDIIGFEFISFGPDQLSEKNFNTLHDVW